MHRSLVLCGFALVVLAGCGKKSSDGGGEPTASTSTPATTPGGAASHSAPAAAALEPCTAFAMLDGVTPKRPPIASTVLGARVPNGGVVKVKRPDMFTIEYFTTSTPRTEVACTMRKQLEDDKWTVESMTGTTSITIVAHKAKASVQLMVGPGEPDIVTTAILTPK